MTAFGNQPSVSAGREPVARPLVFYATCTALALFLTVKVVESRKWK